MTDEDEDIDRGIRGRKWDLEDWWYKPAHVCQRWRNLILGSPSFLGLHLVCKISTPVADMLAYSPPFPLVINYLYRNHKIQVYEEDEEGILLALEQHNRIRCIRVRLPLRVLQKFVMAIDHELPSLEYLLMVMTEEDGDTLVFPERIQAPHLHYLGLEDVVPPIGSRLLTTAVGLVTLCLFMNDSFNYLYPNILLQWISPLSRLETLEITAYPDADDDVETLLSHTPTITHATLPNLRLLSFRGFSTYLEVLVLHIATPRLERLRVVLFERFPIPIPCLVQFMNTTELSFDSIKFGFSREQVCVETYPNEENRRCSFSITVDYWDANGRIAPIVDALGQVFVFSAVEHLILDYVGDGLSSVQVFDDEAVRTEWHKLLRPFSKVKKLRVNHGLVEQFLRFLRLEDGELPLELLPELQELTYSGNSNPGDVFTSFTDARRNADHLVSSRF